MAKITYFLTTLDEAKMYAAKNVLHDFTPFSTRDEAIAGTNEFGGLVDIKLVGKLEMPDETDGLVTQADPAFLTQLGFDPITPTDMASEYRMTFRRYRIPRVAVVPWTEMQEDLSEKEKTMDRVLALTQQLMLYDKDHGPRYDAVMADDSDRAEVMALHNEVTAAARHLRLGIRAKYGLTKEHEEVYVAFRGAMLSLRAEMNGAMARVLALRSRDASELHPDKDDLMQQALEKLEVYDEAHREMQAEAGSLLHPSGTVSKNGLMTNIGPEESAALRRGTLSIERLVELQEQADAELFPDKVAGE